MLTKYEKEFLSRLHPREKDTICRNLREIVITTGLGAEYSLPRNLLDNSFFLDEENFPEGDETPTPIAKILKIGKYAITPQENDVVLTRAGLKYKCKGDTLVALYSDEKLSLEDYEDNKSKNCPSEDILMVIRNNVIVFDDWEA